MKLLDSNGTETLEPEAEKVTETITMLGNLVLLRKTESSETTDGGLLKPARYRGSKEDVPYPRGVVVAQGPGRMLECGRIEPTGVQIGDLVIWNGPNSEMELNGEKLIIIDSAAICAIVTTGSA